jgi:hypothetical protein
MAALLAKMRAAAAGAVFRRDLRDITYHRVSDLPAIA